MFFTTYFVTKRYEDCEDKIEARDKKLVSQKNR